MLTTEVHGQLRALAGRPVAAALPATLGWGRETPAVATALTAAAQAAAREGLLLIRPVESRRRNSRWSDMRWLPVTSPEDLHRHPLPDRAPRHPGRAGHGPARARPSTGGRCHTGAGCGGASGRACRRPGRGGAARRTQRPPRLAVVRRRGSAGASDAASQAGGQAARPAALTAQRTSGPAAPLAEAVPAAATSGCGAGGAGADLDLAGVASGAGPASPAAAGVGGAVLAARAPSGFPGPRCTGCCRTRSPGSPSRYDGGGRRREELMPRAPRITAGSAAVPTRTLRCARRAAAPGRRRRGPEWLGLPAGRRAAG